MLKRLARYGKSLATTLSAQGEFWTNQESKRKRGRRVSPLAS